MNIGNAMKLVRKDRGLSQAEVAALMDVTLNYVSMLENGRRDPSWSYVVKFAEVLEYSLPRLVLRALPQQQSTSVARTIAAELSELAEYGQENRED